MYVGVPRMSAVARYLSQGIDVVIGTRVRDVVSHRTQWMLRSETGEAGCYDAVVITTPLSPGCESLCLSGYGNGP